MRQIGIANDYDGLLELLRQRADELGLSRLTIDEAAGLASGHAGKLLGSGKKKILGRTSLGLILQTLDLALVVVEAGDPAAAQRLARLPNGRSGCARGLPQGKTEIVEGR